MRPTRIINWLVLAACLVWATQGWAQPAHKWAMQESTGGTTLADTGSTGGKTATINTGTFTVKTGPGDVGSATASAVDFTGYHFTIRRQVTWLAVPLLVVPMQLPSVVA